MVSIPFREDLHSDRERERSRFQVLSVSIPFREDLHSDVNAFSAGMISPPVKVSIPFREDLHSDHI